MSSPHSDFDAASSAGNGSWNRFLHITRWCINLRRQQQRLQLHQKQHWRRQLQLRQLPGHLLRLLLRMPGRLQLLQWRRQLQPHCFLTHHMQLFVSVSQYNSLTRFLLLLALRYYLFTIFVQYILDLPMLIETHGISC